MIYNSILDMGTIFNFFFNLFKPSKLKCPKNYDKEKFKMILELFTYITNNHAKLKKFVDVFYNIEICNKKNKIKNILNKKDKKLFLITNDLKYEFKIHISKFYKQNKSNTLTFKQKYYLIELEEDYRLFMNYFVYTTTIKTIKLKLDIDFLNKLNNSEKIEKFMFDLSKNKKNIKLKDFFNKIKNKDVKTIYNTLITPSGI